MAKYAEMVQRLKDKFVEFCVTQIPKNENGKADYLSKIASSAKGGDGSKITLLTNCWSWKSEQLRKKTVGELSFFTI